MNWPLYLSHRHGHDPLTSLLTFRLPTESDVIYNDKKTPLTVKKAGGGYNSALVIDM